MGKLTPDDRALAIEVVERILLGCRVIGLRFAYDPILFFDRDESGSDDGRLHIECGFDVSSSPSVDWSSLSARRPWSEAVPTLLALARRTITAVDLAEEEAHLSLGFEDGYWLHVYGAQPKYESWQVGGPGTSNLVVAMAEGDVAIWSE